jgi:chromosome segregation ATPase
MNIWQLVAALAGTPSVAFVVRAIFRRLDGSARATSREVDYLRGELVRERQQCTDEKAELEARIAFQVEVHSTQQNRIAQLERRTIELKSELEATERELADMRAVVRWATRQSETPQ